MADTELHEPAKLSRIQGVLHRLWRGILVFLEIIGLREETGCLSGSPACQTQTLPRRIPEVDFCQPQFSRIPWGPGRKATRLSITLIAHFVKRKTARALSDVHAMVESINVISGDRYPSLRQAFERIADTLTEAIEDQPEAALIRTGP